ncbi:Methyltransferase domain-containing protein [Lutibacter oricola]|uniref:Methyltransferase domain-containing protein n=1 Tax=Lutibacter oricola TaxID=762486 RepID=A0A1H2XEK9_9FLAO|nr:class I SAM-dependent methyltransferase [Lutibacter oricola]SDW91287.1 Methyltransferase domain-containing protein [Lutibacter oricola]
MKLQQLREAIDGTDIYILDQILKLRYQKAGKILDAGCGSGRNLKWFYNAGHQVYGIDISLDDVNYCKKIYDKEKFKQANVDAIPFTENSFDHVICNAVLHFAEDLSQYLKMLKELLRILKPGGSLFIRMASNFGMENNVEHIENGIYKLPDGSTRFLLTKELLQHLKQSKEITFLETVKTTIVEHKRCMTTLVIEKN